MVVKAEYALIYFLRECLFVFRTCEGCDTSCELTVSGNGSDGISVESTGKTCVSVDSKMGSSGACNVASGLTSTREHLRV